MSQALEFPSEQVHSWPKIEQLCRSELNYLGVEAAGHDYIIAQVENVYDAKCTGVQVECADVPEQCVPALRYIHEAIVGHYKNQLFALLWTIFGLEVRLWRAGVREWPAGSPRPAPLAKSLIG
jgi:hypothetical protein